MSEISSQSFHTLDPRRIFPVTHLRYIKSKDYNSLSWRGCHFYISFPYAHFGSLPSLLSYFSSETGSLHPLFVIFSFSFLYSSYPLRVIGPVPLQHAKEKSIHRTLKLNFRQLCFSDYLVPARTATSHRQRLLTSVFHPVLRKRGCSVSKAQAGEADG